VSVEQRASADDSPVEGAPSQVAQTESAGAEVEGAGIDERDRVRRPGELWRIEESLSAVRAEVAQLEALDDVSLAARIGRLERRWREELLVTLPESVGGELHGYFDWLGEAAASPSELRIGLAQLSGWLDGLMSGLGVSSARPESP